MKKHQDTTPDPIENIAIAAALEENPIVQWISEHGKTLLYVLMGAILLFLILYRTLGAGSSSEKDFYQAENDFAVFQTGSTPEVRKTAFESLNKIINKHPELHAKYDGLIAQTLLNYGETQEAKKFAESAIRRTHIENSPFYYQFAKTTVLISEGHYQDALKDGLKLKEEMLQNAAAAASNPDIKKFGDTLFAINLLRIATLAEQTGDKAEELKTWKEWRQYSQPNTTSSSTQLIDYQAFQAVENTYHDGKISLPVYIEHREKILTEK